jgi:hypothetical protein
MVESGGFSEWSNEVAAGFLANALVVDDRARLTARQDHDEPAVLVAPPRQGGASPIRKQAINSTGNGAHDLYAKSLIDRFAKRGITCGVFCPSEGELETFTQDYSEILKRADVVILDWVLHGFKDGEKTLEIIKMLREENGGKRRARLVLVYSGEKNVLDIVGSIRKALGVSEDGSSYTVCAEALRVSVYVKEHTQVLDEHKSRCIKEESLPEIVIKEFSAMAGGLMSNVALKSLAVLRANTHQLLSTFNRTLDAPYVTHRTLLLPEEASDHIVPLIVSEIQSILEDERVGELAGLANVTKWFKHQLKRGVKFSVPQTEEKTSVQGMSQLLRRGIGDAALTEMFSGHKGFASAWLKSKEKAAKHVVENLTKALTLPAERDAVSDQTLAMLMSIRSRYGSPPPFLRLGTIVLENKRKKTQYLLCVQPVCDSVRIDKNRAFPFLPLVDASNGGACDFLVREGEKTLRFKLQTKPFEARMVTFKPDKRERGIIARTRSTGGQFFTAASRGSTYQWIADLRPDHAQRVANDYAYKISRVGLTESEWLRRISARKDNG